MRKTLTILIALVLGIIIFQLVFAGGPLIGDDWRDHLGSKEPLTFSEYEELIEIYNYEIKKFGGKINVRKGEGVLNALNREILNRPVDRTERMVRKYNKNFKTMSYKQRRKYLINKSR